MTLHAARLSAAAFAPFGQVIETGSVAPLLINEGKCQRFSDLCAFDVQDGHIGLSLFQADIRPLPHACTLLERHPLGSQCFVPMGGSRYLVIVAPDADGVPGTPLAFVAEGTQSVNIGRNTWHGVLAPVSGTGLFAVLDRIGAGRNLQEHPLPTPLMVTV